MRTSHEINTRASSSFTPGLNHCPEHSTTQEKTNRLLETFKMQGKTNGWIFLLEIPGSLFQRSDLRAAAFCRLDNPDLLMFLLFDQKGQEIVIFSDEEAPQQANRLAYSFGQIVRQLDRLGSPESLN